MDKLPNFVFFTWFSAFDPTFFSLKAESCDLISYHCCRQNQFFIKSPGQSDILLAMVMTLGQDGQKLNYDLSPPLGELTHMMIGRNVTNYKNQPPPLLYFNWRHQI